MSERRGLRTLIVPLLATFPACALIHCLLRHELATHGDFLHAAQNGAIRAKLLERRSLCSGGVDDAEGFWRSTHHEFCCTWPQHYVYPARTPPGQIPQYKQQNRQFTAGCQRIARSNRQVFVRASGCKLLRPADALAEISRHALKIVYVGDSVMEQRHMAVQIMIHRSGLHLRADYVSFPYFLRENRTVSLLDTLSQYDILFLNVGLWYVLGHEKETPFSENDYAVGLDDLAKLLWRRRESLPRRRFWIESTPQHFGARGLYSPGVLEGGACNATMVDSLGITRWRNDIANRILAQYPDLFQILHVYLPLAHRWDDHVGIGWDSKLDCTHWCLASSGFDDHIALVLTALVRRLQGLA